MKEKKEKRVTLWMADHGISLLRISLGIIFLWFGLLKYFPGVSPMEDLSVNTVRVLTFNLFSDNAMAVGLATLECLIGIGLLTGKFFRATLILLIFQLIGALSPILLFPEKVFTIIPIVPTLTGQYIIKDIVLISAAILLGGTIRGGKMIADPAVANKAKKVEEEKLENRQYR